VEALDVRRTLSGHGRPFTDQRGHHEGNRMLVRDQLNTLVRVLGERGDATAFDLLPAVYGEKLIPATTAWLLTKTLCYLEHLEAGGRVERRDTDPHRWAAT
jgi:hypothetical protein